MTKLVDVVAYADEFLAARTVRDYCPNGLQIEGRADISRVLSAVTASRAAVEAAIAAEADVLLVHHGYFWRGEAPAVVGAKFRRIRALMRNDIALLAYHLPLDIHPDVGNNARLAPIFDATPTTRLAVEGVELIQFGELHSPLPPAQFAAQLNQRLARAPLHIAGDAPMLRRIAWCSGAAQDYIEHLGGLGVDAYISGEISERTYHSARELGIHYFAAGHHATERYGVQALGDHLARHFGLEHRFFDEANPA